MAFLPQLANSVKNSVSLPQGKSDDPIGHECLRDHTMLRYLPNGRVWPFGAYLADSVVLPFFSPTLFTYGPIVILLMC